MIRILTGDALATLKTLADESVNCVVTSPPYWGLRDYGVEGQMGLERSLGEHIERVVAVFRQVHRVLRKDGTLWLNYGDSYATTPNGRSAQDTMKANSDAVDQNGHRHPWKDGIAGSDKPFSTIGPVYVTEGRQTFDRKNPGPWDNHQGRIHAGGYLKPKDLCGIPWRVAFALQDDGWYLRQDIIWSKPNPMPESVRDRCTKAHEYIFMLSKSERYYYDQDAVKEPASYNSNDTKFPDNWDTSAGSHGSFHRNGREKGRKSDKQRGHSRHHNGFNDCWDAMEKAQQCSGFRNKRSVWEIATAAFAEAHFATFPPQLVKTCILAGCPVGGVVLDPFGGAGTTGLVADRLERNAILIELNPAYVDIAQRRITQDAPLFASVSVASP